MPVEATNVSFSAKDVMALREKTGLGMMDCKEALIANQGDVKKAEEWLRAKLKGKMDTRTERVSAEGRVGVAVAGIEAAVVELRAETDFTAKNEMFVKMVEDVAKAALSQPEGAVKADAAITKRVDDVRITTGENVQFARGTRLSGGNFGSYVHHDGKRAAIVQVDGQVDAALLTGICQHIVAHIPTPIAVRPDEVPASALDQVRADAIRDAKESGKPEQIAQKMAEGRVRKHLEEIVLLNQKFVRDDTKTVKELLPAGVTIKRFVRYVLGG